MSFIIYNLIFLLMVSNIASFQSNSSEIFIEVMKIIITKKLNPSFYKNLQIWLGIVRHIWYVSGIYGEQWHNMYPLHQLVERQKELPFPLFQIMMNIHWNERKIVIWIISLWMDKCAEWGPHIEPHYTIEHAHLNCCWSDISIITRGKFHVYTCMGYFKVYFKRVTLFIYEAWVLLMYLVLKN